MPRNYTPTNEAEANDLSYMNIPRTSLKLRDVIDRAIRGAPIDAPDTSQFFAPEGDEEIAHRWADMSDHVDAHEYVEQRKAVLENENRKKKAKAEPPKAQPDKSSEPSNETPPAPQGAKQTPQVGGGSPKDGD